MRWRFVDRDGTLSVPAMVDNSEFFDGKKPFILMPTRIATLSPSGSVRHSDSEVTEAELRKKDRVTDEFIDLCSECHTASDEAIEENWSTADERDIIRSNN